MRLRSPLVRTSRRAFTLAAALIAAAAPSLASAAGADADWFPLRAGAKWVYEVHRDQTYRPENASIRRLFHGGRMVRFAQPDATTGRFRVVDTATLQPTTDGGEKESLSEWTVYSFAPELKIHAAGATLADGTQKEVAYERPLRVLPTVAVGETWNAGTFQNGGLRAPLEGKVIGVEDLSGAPPWPGALKVRLAGKVSGTATTAKGPTEVESGSYERSIWFVRGVGVVREVTTLEMELRLPEDLRASTIQVFTARLIEHPSSQ